MRVDNCIFCKIIARQIPAEIITQSDDLIVVKDINPRAAIHYLIIPKKHIADIQSFTSEDTLLAANIIVMAQQLSRHLPGSQAFRLVSNNGADVGQVIFHSHFHFLAGQTMRDV